jgi:hypothetical protein
MPVADGRGSGYGLVVACLGAILLLATGCGTGAAEGADAAVNAAPTAVATVLPNAVSASGQPVVATTPADWIELVNAAGRLNAVKYGRASLTFTSRGGAVWIQVGLGPASAWHVGVVKFHCVLYPEDGGAPLRPQSRSSEGCGSIPVSTRSWSC